MLLEFYTSAGGLAFPKIYYSYTILLIYSPYSTSSLSIILNLAQDTILMSYICWIQGEDKATLAPYTRYLFRLIKSHASSLESKSVLCWEGKTDQELCLLTHVLRRVLGLDGLAVTPELPN